MPFPCMSWDQPSSVLLTWNETEDIFDLSVPSGGEGFIEAISSRRMQLDGVGYACTTGLYYLHLVSLLSTQDY